MRSSLVLTLAVLAAPLAAQSPAGAGDDLKRAVRLYEQFNVEAARPVLWSVVKREKEISRAEAAKAFTYLGAAYAVLAMRDSSIALFREALKRDSTITLDPKMFSKSEMEALDAARREP